MKNIEDLAKALKNDPTEDLWNEFYVKIEGKIKYWAAGNQDIAQETWCKIIENINDYNSSRPFLPWAKALTVNSLIDDNKRLKNRSTVNLAEADGLLSCESEFLDVSLEKEEVYDLVRDSVEVVINNAPKYGNLLDLYSRGYSYKEMSEIFRLPIGTVKSTMHKAKELLKEQLESLGIHEYPF